MPESKSPDRRPAENARHDETIVFGEGGHSVLHSLGQKLPEVPRVLLRGDGKEDDSVVVQPQSSEMPTGKGDSRYQLHGEIARGGMGAILKGRDTDLNRDLAIKVLLESAQRQAGGRAKVCRRGANRRPVAASRERARL